MDAMLHGSYTHMVATTQCMAVTSHSCFLKLHCMAAMLDGYHTMWPLLLVTTSYGCLMLTAVQCKCVTLHCMPVTSHGCCVMVVGRDLQCYCYLANLQCYCYLASALSVLLDFSPLLVTCPSASSFCSCIPLSLTLPHATSQQPLTLRPHPPPPLPPLRHAN